MNTLEEQATKYGWSADELERQKELKKTFQSRGQKKLVKDLEVGDVLTFTRERVVSSPVSLIRTPKGKLELTLERPAGGWIVRTWNAHTIVVINNPISL